MILNLEEFNVDDNIDLDRMYTAVSDALYLPENVTQEYNDLVLEFITKLQKAKLESITTAKYNYRKPNLLIDFWDRYMSGSYIYLDRIDDETLEIRIDKIYYKGNINDAIDTVNTITEVLNKLPNYERFRS